MTQTKLYPIVVNASLQHGEEELLQDLAMVFKKYAALDVINDSETNDFKTHIAQLQRIIAARPALRILNKQKKLVYK